MLVLSDREIPEEEESKENMQTRNKRVPTSNNTSPMSGSEMNHNKIGINLRKKRGMSYREVPEFSDVDDEEPIMPKSKKRMKEQEQIPSSNRRTRSNTGLSEKISDQEFAPKERISKSREKSTNRRTRSASNYSADESEDEEDAELFQTKTRKPKQVEETPPRRQTRGMQYNFNTVRYDTFGLDPKKIKQQPKSLSRNERYLMRLQQKEESLFEELSQVNEEKTLFVQQLEDDDDEEVYFNRSSTKKGGAQSKPRRNRQRISEDEDIDEKEIRSVEVEPEEDEQDNHEQEAGRYNTRGRSRKRLARYSEDNTEKNILEKLRPRTVPKNYQVRIPLYDASPSRDQILREQKRQYEKHRFKKLISKNNGNVFDKLIMGPFLMDEKDDNDSDMEIGRSNSRNWHANAQPMNSSQLLIDSDPVQIDPNLSFEHVGGLKEHIKKLKEMILLPLMYPEIFNQFQMKPPKGVLFHGPPGTGKTLLARVLAAQCSNQKQKVTFFMRKGADLLSKWVGESERQLRLLFQLAKEKSPAIIFFDEIDGLAPVRSSKQDQIHASIVTTLLALMDGLEDRGQVVVIGATNRIDAVDSALRRPGRFDREFYFDLPDKEARKEILQIMTRYWSISSSQSCNQSVDQQSPIIFDAEPSQALKTSPIDKNDQEKELFMDVLAEETRGYCGSDLRALCTEAALHAVERVFPDIYQSKEKIELNLEKVQLSTLDFAIVLKKFTPAAHRVAPVHSLPLSEWLQPLLSGQLNIAANQIQKIFPYFKANTEHKEDISLRSGLPKLLQAYRPYFLLYCPTCFSAALLTMMDPLPVHTLDLNYLLQNAPNTSAESNLIDFFQAVKRQKPCVVHLKRVDRWWIQMGSLWHRLFWEAMEEVNQPEPRVLLLITAYYSDQNRNQELEEEKEEMNKELFCQFKNDEVFKLPPPSINERILYFKNLVKDFLADFVGLIQQEDGHWQLHPNLFFPHYYPQLVTKPKAVLPTPAISRQPAVEQDDWNNKSEKEIQEIYSYHQRIFRRLRMLLREFMYEVLKSKEYKMLVKNLNPMEDYGQLVKTDAQDILSNVEQHKYLSLKPFRRDLLLFLQSFRLLALDRGEPERLSHLNALADLLEEGMTNLDQRLISETEKCARIHPKVKALYEEKVQKGQLMGKWQKDLLLEMEEMEKKYFQQQNEHEQQLKQQEEDRRTSQRLKGNEPVLYSEEQAFFGFQHMKEQRKPSNDEGQKEVQITELPAIVENDDMLTVENEEVAAVQKEAENDENEETEMTEEVEVKEVEEIKEEEPVIEGPEEEKENAEATDVMQEDDQENEMEVVVTEDQTEEPKAEPEAEQEKDSESVVETKFIPDFMFNTVNLRPLKPLTRSSLESLMTEIANHTESLDIDKLESIRVKIQQTAYQWRQNIKSLAMFYFVKEIWLLYKREMNETEINNSYCKTFLKYEYEEFAITEENFDLPDLIRNAVKNYLQDISF